MDSTIIEIGSDDAKYIKQLHQDMLRAAKALTEAQASLRGYVVDLRGQLAVPADTAEVRWLMTEDATKFFSVDATLPQDFTKPVRGPGE